MISKAILVCFLTLTLVAVLSFPSQIVLAQNKASGNSKAPGNSKTNLDNSQINTPTAPAGGSGGANTLFNPINYTNLGDLIIGVTKGFTLIIAIVSVGFIVLGGAELVVSAGNTEAVEKGKKTITWAIIGLIVALMSFSIVAIVENLIGANY